MRFRTLLVALAVSAGLLAPLDAKPKNRAPRGGSVSRARKAPKVKSAARTPKRAKVKRQTHKAPKRQTARRSKPRPVL